jgi:hypothetical protein
MFAQLDPRGKFYNLDQIRCITPLTRKRAERSKTGDTWDHFLHIEFVDGTRTEIATHGYFDASALAPVIPANSGFQVAVYYPHCNDDGEETGEPGFIDYEPVVGWRVEPEFDTVEPVTAGHRFGGSNETGLVYPDGRVHEFDQDFDDLVAWKKHWDDYYQRKAEGKKIEQATKVAE